MSRGTAATPNAAFIDYPRQARYGRTLPKSKVYEHAQAKTRLKKLFVEQVEQIVWDYKLAPETINLPASSVVPEIQVFTIHLKTPDLNPDVLHCIDSAVRFPTVFELSFQGCRRVTAAHKRPGASPPGQWAVSSYFSTGWQPGDCPRAVLPTALDLAGLYEHLLRRLIALRPRAGEALVDLVARMDRVAAKRLEVDKTRGKLAREKQFNRKVQINAELRQLRHELETLTH